jgi:hypothetical protein
VETRPTDRDYLKRNRTRIALVLDGLALLLSATTVLLQEGTLAAVGTRVAILGLRGLARLLRHMR